MRGLGILAVLTICLIAPSAASATACSAIANGSWTTAAIWDCNEIPDSGDSVVIGSDGTNVTVNESSTVGATSVTLIGGSLILPNNTTLNSPVQVNGGIVSTGLASDINGNFTLAGGELRGFGNINGALANTNGIVRPGQTGTNGSISADSYTQSAAPANATLAVDVTSPTDVDSLAVSGTASIAGALSTAAAPTLVKQGQLFPIVTAGTRTGTFFAVSGPTDLTPVYTPTTVFLAGPANPIIPPPPAPAAPTITLPSNKKCKKSVKVKITPPAGTTIKTSSVKAGKKTVQTKSAKGVVTAKVKLKKKTKISIAASTAAGGTATLSKTYKRCK